MPHDQAYYEAQRDHDYKYFRITMIFKTAIIQANHQGNQVNQANHGLRQGASHAS